MFDFAMNRRSSVESNLISRWITVTFSRTSLWPVRRWWEALPLFLIQWTLLFAPSLGESGFYLTIRWGPWDCIRGIILNFLFYFWWLPFPILVMLLEFQSSRLIVTSVCFELAVYNLSYVIQKLDQSFWTSFSWR